MVNENPIMNSFHFISTDKNPIAEINNNAWINSTFKLHESHEKFEACIENKDKPFVFLDIDSYTESENIRIILQLNQIGSKVVVVSKDTSFAYNAIKAGAHNYVLKSNFSKEALLVSDQNGNNLNNNKRLIHKVAIHCTDAVHYLSLNEIIRCQAESNYTRIVMGKKSILIAKTLKKVEALLPPISFYRSHRSHLINLSHVKMVRHEKGGTIVTSDDCSIPISRNRKSFFWNQIQSVIN